MFFFAAITGSIGIAIGDAIGGAGSYSETIGSLVGLWAGLIPGSIIVCRARTKASFASTVGLRFRFPFDFVGLLIGVVSSYVVLIGYWIAAHWIHGLDTEAGKPAEELTKNAHGVGFWLFAVLLVVGAPLVEEIFYRGMLFPSLKRFLAPAWAILVGGFVFGAVHFDVATLVGLGCFGVVLCYLAHRYERLGPGVFAHAAFNLVAVIGLWAAR